MDKYLNMLKPEFFFHSFLWISFTWHGYTLQGVGPEAVVVASALSQPKTLFRIASPLIHTDPDEICDIVRTTLMGAIALDAGMYSEPLM